MRHWAILAEAEEHLRKLERRWKSSGSDEDFHDYYHGTRRYHDQAAAVELLRGAVGHHVREWQQHHTKAVAAARALRNAPRGAHDDYFDEHRHHLRQAHKSAQESRQNATKLIRAVNENPEPEHEARLQAAQHLSREHSSGHDNFVHQVVDWHRTPVIDPRSHYGDHNRAEAPDSHFYVGRNWDEARGIRRSLTHHNAGYVTQHDIVQGERNPRGGRDVPRHLMTINVHRGDSPLGPGIHSPPEWR